LEWVLTPYLVEAVGKDIYLFGRNKDGKKYVKKDTTFKPYFYIPTEKESEYKSIFGENVKKIHVNHPGLVPKEREKYPKHFEADVVYTNRYIIDKFDEMEEESIRKCFIDIEALSDNGRFSDPATANAPITALCCYDSFLKKYNQFAWHPNKEHHYIAKTTNHNLFVFSSEKEMIKTWCKYIRSTNPDMLLAWNGDGYDYPYIMNRMSKIGLDPKVLSLLDRFEVGGGKYKKNMIGGRLLLDYMWIYKMLTQGDRDFSLDAVAHHEKLKTKKMKIHNSFDDLWMYKFDEFITYNKVDVEVMVALEEKLKLIDIMDSMRRIGNCQFMDTFNKTRVIDPCIMTFLKSKKLVVPTNPNKGRKRTAEDKFKGGAVALPKIGLHKNVFHGDIKSLYPSIMISYNISPETVGGEGITIGNGTTFSNEKKGIIPEVLERLYSQRLEWKDEKNERARTIGKDKIYNQLDMKQYALKIILNSFYGALASPFYRLHKKEIGESITFVGRKIITYSKNVLEIEGFEVIYGDTDSVFFKTSEQLPLHQMVEVGNKTMAFLNLKYISYCKKQGLDKIRIEMVLEDIYKTLFFAVKSTGVAAKKKYAGRICWEDGKEIDEFKIVGFEGKKSDTPRFGKEVQKKVLEMICDETPKDEVYFYINESTQKIKNGEINPREIAIPKGLNADPYTGYVTKLPHVRAAIWANKYHNENFSKGDKVKYVHVKSTPDGIPQTDVVGFKLELPEGYEIDYNIMIDKAIYMKIERIFKSVGWSVQEMNGQSSLGDWSV